MVFYMMTGILAVLAFLCVSQAIPEIMKRRPSGGAASSGLKQPALRKRDA